VGGLGWGEWGRRGRTGAPAGRGGGDGAAAAARGVRVAWRLSVGLGCAPPRWCWGGRRGGPGRSHQWLARGGLPSGTRASGGHPTGSSAVQPRSCVHDGWVEWGHHRAPLPACRGSHRGWPPRRARRTTRTEERRGWRCLPHTGRRTPTPFLRDTPRFFPATESAKTGTRASPSAPTRPRPPPACGRCRP